MGAEYVFLKCIFKFPGNRSLGQVTTEEDLVNLPKFNIYLKLMIDGITSEAFSAVTLPPIAAETGNAEKVIEASRASFGTPRAQVEETILRWSESKPTVEGEVAGMPEKAPPKKKAYSKPLFDYDCTRCNKHMSIPVELDRNRPVYCEDCIEIVREERKSGKKSRPPAKKSAPKVTEGEVVAKDTGKEVGLSALAGGEEKEKKKEVKKEEPKKTEEKKPEEKKPEKKGNESQPAGDGSAPKKKRRRRRKKPGGGGGGGGGQTPAKPSGGDGVFPW